MYLQKIKRLYYVYYITLINYSIYIYIYIYIYLLIEYINSISVVSLLKIPPNLQNIDKIRQC